MSRNVWIPWEQPVLSSDTDYGVVSASSINTSANSYPWKALDGIMAGNTTSWEAMTGVVPAWWMWKLPHRVKIYSLTLFNKYSGTNKVTHEVNVYADENMNIQIGSTAEFEPTAFSVAEVIPDDPVITDTIKINCISAYNTGQVYVGLGEVILTAEMEVTEYEVAFCDWDGTVLSTDWVVSGGSATAPSDPVRSGYEFTGWDVSFDNITEDTVVTAQYRSSSVTGAYCVNFKNYDDSLLKTEYVLLGGSATAPTVPEREGYNFSGWDKSLDNITADTDIKATFTPKVYHTVRFLDWNNTVLKTETVEDGCVATAPDDPVRSGYRFKGWNNTFFEVTADMTITALYEKLVYYYVYFRDWDGTILKRDYVLKGEDAVPPDDPEREGYYFDGWDKSYTNVLSTVSTTAVYERDIEYVYVSFYDDEGNWLSDAEIESGTAARPPLAPEKEGYIFDHWDADFSCVTEDMDVHAVYREEILKRQIYIYDRMGAFVKSVDRVISATIHDSLDGELTFEFSTLADRSVELCVGYVAVFEKYCFNIVRVTKSIVSGIMTTAVSCEHISYVLNDDIYKVEDCSYSGTPYRVLDNILYGTPFVVGVVEIDTVIRIEVSQETTRRALVMQAVGLCGGEIEYDGYSINIRQHRGSTERKDLLEMRNVTDVSVTYENRIAAASYSVSFYKAVDYAVGDDVSICFSPLGINTYTRIVSIEYNPFYRYSITVEVGDHKPELTDYLAEKEKEDVEKNNILKELKEKVAELEKTVKEINDQYKKLLEKCKLVKNISVSDTQFTVSFEDKTSAKYNYTADTMGRMTSITKVN